MHASGRRVRRLLPQVSTADGNAMIEAELSLRELAMIASTRAILGAGVALLLADQFSGGMRKRVGWALVAVGALTTIPLATIVFGRRRRRLE
jgi:hypothetical protein